MFEFITTKRYNPIWAEHFTRDFRVVKAFYIVISAMPLFISLCVLSLYVYIHSCVCIYVYVYVQLGSAPAARYAHHMTNDRRMIKGPCHVFNFYCQRFKAKTLSPVDFSTGLWICDKKYMKI